MKKNKWFNEVYIDKMSLAISLYPELSLTSDEFLVVLCILHLNKASRKINNQIIMEFTKLSADKIDEIIDSLVAKRYLVIKITKADVTFSLDNLFEVEEEVKEKKATNLFALVEQEFGRVLSQKESEIIAGLSVKYPKKDILNALREALIYDKKSLNYISKILTNKEKDEQE